MCHRFVYTINQDKNGYIWLGTGQGLCKYDGFSFHGDVSGDTIPQSFIRTSFRDPDGNLWFGHNDGNISYYDGDRFQWINRGSGLTSTINCITRDPSGNMLFATQSEGIIVVDRQMNHRLIRDAFSDMLLSSLLCISSEYMLIGFYDGLYLYRTGAGYENMERTGKVGGLPPARITALTRKNGDELIWAGTEDQGLFFLSGYDHPEHSIEVRKFGEHLDVGQMPVQSIMEDSESGLWISTRGEGLYRFDYDPLTDRYKSLTHYHESNGLGSMFIRETFEDHEGNIWVGTYGKGLAVMYDEAFVFYRFPELGQNISSLLAEKEANWAGGEGFLLKADSGNWEDREIYTAERGIPQDLISSVYKDVSGRLWFGTQENGLYYLNENGHAVSFYRSLNSLENTVNAITGRNGEMWVATNNGVYSVDPGTRERTHYTTTEGLPHNRISDLLIDPGGNVWIATRNNGIHSVTADIDYKIHGNYELDFVSLALDREGNIWAATNRDGVFQFKPDTLVYYSAVNGLKSNYCYSLISGPGGEIWVGHRLGLSRIDIESGSIQTYGVEEGISGDCNPNSVALSEAGKLLFGTTDGIIQFNPEREKENNTPPILNITSVVISDQPYDPGKPIMLPYGIYKMRVEFIGLNYQAPEEVTYQYMLEGYDDWSDPSPSPYAVYSRIEDGDYNFQVRSCNSEGVCNEAPVQFRLMVRMPVWKTWWFITIMLFALVLTVFLIIKYRERKQKQFQEILQKKLDERTREVVLQKEEIEIKNKDITDSINYAQRIQASILPPVSKLEEAFAGTFVFYLPRDIVSGDFYWYDTINRNKFVIVCADSTGHGVPGAFMSMIGTTLIKDIVQRKDVSSPSDILKTLDMEVMSALNQNLEAERSNDGMDIIVAEINLESLELTISSAMRPMIIYQNGEQIYVRGSRSSVGGQYERENKVFGEHHFKMKHGDLIYMFSDGYPDQFGGPLGKKFKMVRLKNLVRDIHNKPMEEQYNYIKSNFFLWKEDLEQVDDVLFMGIKL